MKYTTISFPALGIEFDPARNFEIGPLNIHLYGILIATGLLLAVLYACIRCKQFGLKQDDLLDGGISTHPTPYPPCISGTAVLPFMAACWVPSSVWQFSARSRRSGWLRCWIW